MGKLFWAAVAAILLAGCGRSPEFYFGRANRQLSVGKDKMALQDYNKAIMLRRKFPEALTARGMLYERQGDKQKAMLDYRKSIEVDPSYLPAYNNAGALLMDGDNYREAVDLFSQALSVNRDYAYALLNRGLSYYKQNDCASARADLTRAVALNDKFELAFYHRALCSRKEGRAEEAAADLDAVLALNPAAALAWLERGKLRYAARDHAGAAGDFAKAHELNKKDPAAAYWLGLALFKTGYLEGALEKAQAAYELKPDSHLAAGLLGDICAARKDYPKAREYYAAAAGLSSKYAAFYKGRLAGLGRAGR